MARSRSLAVALLALAVYPGLMSVGASAQAGACDPAAAEALVGRDRVTDDQARQSTGATLVRQVGPGDPVTMDFQPDRVTIETDPATGRIVRAACG